MNNNSPQSASKILRALHEFAFGSEEDVNSFPIEQIEENLRAEGIDSEKAVKELHQKFSKIRAGETLEQARTERVSLLEKLKEYFDSQLSQPTALKEEVIRRIREISVRQPETALAYFRKFEQASEKDLKSLSEDLALLEKMSRDAEVS